VGHKGFNAGMLTPVLVILLALAATAPAEVKLPNIIGSHMVLQRDVPLQVWGWADPGEKVTVVLDADKAVATADQNGDWKVTLKPVKADGKPHQLVVTGDKAPDKKITLEDVLIGEVWLGSGQSNMEMRLEGTQKGKEAVAAANCPQIRLFHVPKVQSKAPAKDVNASWKACTPQTAGSFSAVLYYFGKRIHQELNVPVGLINSSWGGSPIEPWLAEPGKSGGMYNGMIAPVCPFALRGLLWYQGETNAFAKNGMKYFDKSKNLIEGWRRVWGLDLPFYFVQIAPFSGYPEGELPALWEAQVATLKIPGTGMAVITDLVDNTKDIHPRNKRDVGNRLALWALAKNYGKKDLVYSGPLYKSMKVEGDKVRLNFAHVGGGLMSRDGKPLTEFQIAGADGKFVPAEAVIDGNTVVVAAESVKSPTQVRFAFHKTANPNLANKEGLPASPFQTNNWQGGTSEDGG